MSKWVAITGWIGFALAANAAPVQQLWEARYNGPASREDLLTAMTVDANGRVYVTGSSDNNVNPDPYATIKYHTNGVQLWVARYSGPRQIDVPSAIAVDNQGYVYVTGFSHGDASGYDPDYATIKYAPEGTELWVARYNGAGTNAQQTADNPYAMLVNSAGEVYVTGASMSPEGSMDFATIKYDTNGAHLWVQRYNGMAGRFDSARALGIDGAGNIYVCGYSQRQNYGYDIVLIKYSPEGTQLWLSRFITQSYSEPTLAMKVDAAGNAYIAVSAIRGPSAGNGAWRLSVLKYDSTGNLLWDVQRRTVRDDEIAHVAGMQLDDADNVCLLALVSNVNDTDYLTTKFSADGDELWSSRFNSGMGFPDVPHSIAVDSGGNIYVTGVSYNNAQNNYQFATLKYRPNGHREWIVSTATSNNQGVSVAVVNVDSAGHVYVSGSVGLIGTKDYYTVKYRQTPQTGAPVIVSAPTPQTVAAGGTATHFP